MFSNDAIRSIPMLLSEVFQCCSQGFSNAALRGFPMLLSEVFQCCSQGFSNAALRDILKPISYCRILSRPSFRTTYKLTAKYPMEFLLSIKIEHFSTNTQSLLLKIYHFNLIICTRF